LSQSLIFTQNTETKKSKCTYDELDIVVNL
jgi:hypothetical protein